MNYFMVSNAVLVNYILIVFGKILVHKIVLSSASPYFKAMFTGGLKETEMTRVRLQGVSVSSMARIITFMYTGRIHVTEGIMIHKLEDL